MGMGMGTRGRAMVFPRGSSPQEVWILLARKFFFNKSKDPIQNRLPPLSQGLVWAQCLEEA